MTENGCEASPALEPKSRGRIIPQQQPSPCLHAQQRDAEQRMPAQREGSNTRRASLQAPAAEELQGQLDTPQALNGKRRRASVPALGAAQLQQQQFTAGQGASKRRACAADPDACDLQPAARHNKTRHSLASNRDQSDTPSGVCHHTTIGSPAVDGEQSPFANALHKLATHVLLYATDPLVGTCSQ